MSKTTATRLSRLCARRTALSVATIFLSAPLVSIIASLLVPINLAAQEPEELDTAELIRTVKWDHHKRGKENANGRSVYVSSLDRKRLAEAILELKERHNEDYIEACVAG